MQSAEVYDSAWSSYEIKLWCEILIVRAYKCKKLVKNLDVSPLKSIL